MKIIKDVLVCFDRIPSNHYLRGSEVNGKWIRRDPCFDRIPSNQNKEYENY